MIDDEPIDIDGKKISRYDAEQKLRYYERGVRRWKREADMLAAVGMDNTKERMKIAEWQGKAKAWCEKTGLRRDYAREAIGTASGRQVYGLGRNNFSEKAGVDPKDDNLPKSLPQKDILNVINDKSLTLKQKLNKIGVSKLSFGKLTKSLTDNEIIQKVGGRDNTLGSCAPMSYAFAMNKAGFDVLDCRGGYSQQFFSSKKTNIEIAKILKGTVVYSRSDLHCAKLLMRKMADGEYYSMGVGRHRAIVIRQKDKYYFAEMQNEKKFNGFKELNEHSLKIRFDCDNPNSKQKIKIGSMFNVKNVKGNKDFIQLMQYINTKENEQQKS